MRVRLFFVSLLLVILAKEGPCTAGPRKRRQEDRQMPQYSKGYSQADQSLPANIFRKSVKTETKKLLLCPVRLRGITNQDTANFIAQNLKRLQDPDNTVPPFGMAYSVAVWNVTIPERFHNAIQSGTSSFSKGKGHPYSAVQGVTWTERCIHKDIGNKSGTLGWPCSGSGLFAVQANTSSTGEKNIAVMFVPKTRHLPSKSMVAMLHLAKDHCLYQQVGMGGPVDLTRLSECIFDIYSGHHQGKLNSALQSAGLPRLKYRLKGIAVVPSFSSGSADFGFSSEAGGILKAEEYWLGGSRLIFVALPSFGRK